MANRQRCRLALSFLTTILLASPLAAQAQQAPPARQPAASAPNNAPRADAVQPQPGAALPNGQPLQPQRLAVEPPFVLTPEQQAELDQVLAQWEQKSDAINTFECAVKRFEYDPAFGEPTTHLLSQAEANLKYAAPDKGSFQVTKLELYTKDPQAQKWILKASPDLDHWTCDGKSTFEVNHKEKKIIERPIPPELQGKSIIDGPLPFVFGAKAAMLKQRYYLRVLPSDPAKNTVWIEARPKTQKDASNYAKVEIILSKAKMLPSGIQIYGPNANPDGNPQDQPRTAFALDEPTINGFAAQVGGWFVNFARPNYFGYKLIVEPPQGVGPPPAQPAQQTPPPNAGVQQASRVKPASR